MFSNTVVFELHVKCPILPCRKTVQEKFVSRTVEELLHFGDILVILLKTVYEIPFWTLLVRWACSNGSTKLSKTLPNYSQMFQWQFQTIPIYAKLLPTNPGLKRNFRDEFGIVHIWRVRDKSATSYLHEKSYLFIVKHFTLDLS